MSKYVLGDQVWWIAPGGGRVKVTVRAGPFNPADVGTYGPQYVVVEGWGPHLPDESTRTVRERSLRRSPHND